jgi:hypothetical protein
LKIYGKRQERKVKREERREKSDTVGVGATTTQEKITAIAAPPSVAQKRDLQKPSLVREGGPLAVDE